MSKACTLNPISGKTSTLAEEVGFVTYNKIIDKYFDTSDPDLLKSFFYENAAPVYNPAVMDNNNDFMLFKHTTEVVSPSLTKHKYTPLEGSIADAEESDDIVILPIKTIVHVQQSTRPYAVGSKGRIIRIESINDNIGVSINNIDEIAEIKPNTSLSALNDQLYQTHTSVLSATKDMIFNNIPKRNKKLLLKQLVDELDVNIRNEYRKKGSTALYNLAIEMALMTNDFNLANATKLFLSTKKQTYASISQETTIATLDLMNKEVKHNESIMLDPNSGKKMIDPLTGQYLLNHSYALQTDVAGNLLKTPIRIGTSATNEIDISSPFNRYQKIFDMAYGSKNEKDKHWTKYLSNKALQLLVKKSDIVDTPAYQPDIEIDPYAEFEGQTDRPSFVKFKTKQIVVDIAKAAIKSDEAEILRLLSEFADKADLNAYDVNALLNSILGKELTNIANHRNFIKFGAIKEIPQFRNIVNNATRVATPQSNYYFENNLIKRLRALNFGTIAGTYVHGITQTAMAAQFYYGKDYQDNNPNASDDAFQNMIDDNSTEDGEFHDFIEYAKEIINLRDNDVVNYNKILPMIESAKTTLSEFNKLAETVYKSDTGTKNKPKIYFENVVLTREYGSFNSIKHKNKNRSLASKVDITVVFPNGKVFIIDVKSSTKNAIKAAAITSSTSVNRYNHYMSKEVKYIDYNGNESERKETAQEGYIRSEQEKHSKQLEIYRKIYITRGIKAEDIETYIYFVAVEEIDKTTPIDNSAKEGVEKNIDNVVDKIGKIVVPDFSTQGSTVRTNKSLSFTTDPMSHMIPGDTLHSHKKQEEAVDAVIGTSTKDIAKQRRSNKHIETVERQAKVKYDDKLDNFTNEMDDIKAKIVLYISNARTAIKTSRFSDSEKKTKQKGLDQLSKDLQNITNDVYSIINFIEYAHRELISTDVSDGLTDAMSTEIDNYQQRLNDPEQDPYTVLNEATSRVQFIHSTVYQFDTLRVIRQLNDTTGGLLLTTDQNAMLAESLENYERAMSIYDRNYKSMIAEQQMLFHDTGLDEDYEIILNVALDEGMATIDKETGMPLFTKENLRDYRADLKEGFDVEQGTKYNAPYGHIGAIYDRFRHLNITKEEIESELDTLQKDIGGLSLHIMGAGMQNNKSIQLMFKMFKSTVASGEIKTRKELTGLDKMFSEYRSAVGASNDMKKLFGHVLERKKRKRYDSETKKLIEDDVWQFLNEYDTDYMLKRDELARQRSDAREQNNKLLERQLTQEIKAWNDENLQRLYSDVVYEIEDLLDKPINGKAGLLRQTIEAIDFKIFEIQSEYEINNPSEYSNDHKTQLINLRREKRLIADPNNMDGTPKSQEGQDLAALYTEYKERKNETVSSDLDIDSYNKAFNEAKVKYKNNPVKLQRWLDSNSDLVLSDKFYAEHSFYILSKNILWTLEQMRTAKVSKNTSPVTAESIAAGINEKSEDEIIRENLRLLEEKYTFELTNTGEANPEQFVSNMQLFMQTNNIELVKSTDDATLKMMEMLKPYRDSTGKVDYKSLPEHIEIRVKTIMESREAEKVADFQANGKLTPRMPAESPYRDMYGTLAKHIGELEQFSIRSEYYDMIDAQLEYHKGDMDAVKNSPWWKSNHYMAREYKYKKNESEDEYDPSSAGDVEARDENGDLLSNEKYWVIEKEKPINVWTRMTPSDQKSFRMNQQKLSILLKLINKYEINNTEVELTDVTDNTTSSVNLTDIVSLLSSDRGKSAIDKLRTLNQQTTKNTLGKDLDLSESNIDFEGKIFKVYDLINAALNGLQTEMLKRDKTGLSKKELQNEQQDYDLLDDLTLTIKNETDDSVQYKLSRVIFELDEEKSKFYQRRPNILYNKIKTKPEYLKSEAELRTLLTESSFENNDRAAGDIDLDNLEPLPKENMWRNKRYDDMMNDTSVKGAAIKKFYTEVTKFYLDKQKLYPAHKRRGLIIPSRKKSGNELINNSDDLKSKRKQIATQLKDLVKPAQDDSEEEGNLDEDVSTDSNNRLMSPTSEFFGAGYSSNAISIPTQFVQNMDADDVSLDIISSMQQFSLATNKYNQLSSMVDSVRMMNTAYIRREDENKVLERDSKGRKIIKAISDKIPLKGNNKFQGVYQTSNVFQFFQTFVEQQFAGINNKPTTVGGYRIDKGVDTLMMLQSKASLGGFSATSALKGTVNALQASISVGIEAAGGEFFSGHTLRKVLTSNTHVELFKHQAQELQATAKGSTISVTKTGQLMDHYDAMQGNFADSMGNNVSSKALPKLFKSSSWFFNQYFGEYLNSMTVLNAFLEEHKVLDDGTVITWKDYTKKPSKKGLSKEEYEAAMLNYKAVKAMSDNDYRTAKKEFRDKPSLRDSIQQNETGTALEITKVTTKGGEVLPKWELGSRKDIDMRLKMQAISREINGAYSQADKNISQQYWWGRALMMYKKHLVPSISRRFGNVNGLASQELGSVRRGYHIDHYLLYKNLFNNNKGDLKKLLGVYKSIVTGVFSGDISERHAGERFTIAQIANIRKSLFEHALLLVMMSLFLLIDLDDDDEDVSDARYLLLYTLNKLRTEQNALAISPFAGSNPVKDNWKNLESPSALIKTITDIIDLSGVAFSQANVFGDREDLYYKHASGIAEKGDSKLIIKTKKLIKNFYPTLGLTNQTAKSYYDYTVN